MRTLWLLWLLSPLALAQADRLEKFEQAWAAGALDQAVAQLSDNVSIVWSVDPATPKQVPDATFTGHEQAAGFLESFLPGFRLEPGERAGLRQSLTLSYDWLRALGLERATAQLDATLAADGRIASLRLALTPESSARYLAGLPDAEAAWVRRFYEEINAHRYEVIDQRISPLFVQHTMWPTGPGRAGLKQLFEGVRRAFPDARFTIDALVIEGDTAAARMTARYTHQGEFFGIPATGKPLTVMKMDFFRFLNGQCIEHWDSLDRLGLLQQIGVVPKVPQWTQTQGYDGFR